MATQHFKNLFTDIISFVHISRYFVQVLDKGKHKLKLRVVTDMYVYMITQPEIQVVRS